MENIAERRIVHCTPIRCGMPVPIHFCWIWSLDMLFLAFPFLFSIYPSCCFFHSFFSISSSFFFLVLRCSHLTLSSSFLFLCFFGFLRLLVWFIPLFFVYCSLSCFFLFCFFFLSFVLSALVWKLLVGIDGNRFSSAACWLGSVSVRQSLRFLPLRFVFRCLSWYLGLFWSVRFCSVSFSSPEDFLGQPFNFLSSASFWRGNQVDGLPRRFTYSTTA